MKYSEKIGGQTPLVSSANTAQRELKENKERKRKREKRENGVFEQSQSLRPPGIVAPLPELPGLFHCRAHCRKCNAGNFRRARSPSTLLPVTFLRREIESTEWRCDYGMEMGRRQSSPDWPAKCNSIQAKRPRLSSRPPKS
jgi:hypothetical protein